MAKGGAWQKGRSDGLVLLSRLTAAFRLFLREGKPLLARVFRLTKPRCAKVCQGARLFADCAEIKSRDSARGLTEFIFLLRGSEIEWCFSAASLN